MNQSRRHHSQADLRKLFQTEDNRSNYYEHHNMPTRSTNRNFYKNNTYKKETDLKGDWLVTGKEVYPDMGQKLTITRSVFYQKGSQIKNSSRFSSLSNLSRPKTQRNQQQSSLGPGFYNYDSVMSSNLLSQNRKPMSARITTSSKNKDRLVFQMTDAPGPAKYNKYPDKNEDQNWGKKGYKISNTLRSSIINQNQTPGPGYYQSKQSCLKRKERKGPFVEYKFVYGHPS